MTITKRNRTKVAKAPPAETPAAGRTFGYCRVSTSRQADAGESLDVQQRTLEGYAKMLGRTLDHVYVERGVSGSKPLDQREQGSLLIGRLRSGDTIITPKLDRMFRSAVDALDVMEAMRAGGIALHMIDLGGDVTSNGGNTVSKLVFTILAAVAEAERDRTRERIAEVKRDQRERGRFLGGLPPYGYRRIAGTKSEMEPIPEKQRFIRQIIRDRQNGHSLRSIQARLAAKGEMLALLSIDRVAKAAAVTKGAA
jgi:DNA invertase Pin-like site-specific DNA recombinase